MTTQPPAGPKPQSILIRKMLFPTEYGLFIAVVLIDVLFTMLYLEHAAGKTDPDADWLLLKLGKPGFITFKVVLMLVVIGLTEVVGRRRKVLARVVIWLAVAALTLVAVNSAMRYYNALQLPSGPVTPEASVTPEGGKWGQSL